MSRIFLSGTFATLFLLVIISLSPAAALAESVGSFSRVEGRVDILKSGSNYAVAVKVGDSVSMGDIIRTKSDGKAEVLFKDATTVRLAPGTRIKIDEYTFAPDNSRKQGIIALLRGKIRAIVSKAKVASIIPVSTGTSTFTVQTPTATAGVRGTDLFVFYDRGITGVLFKEGMGFVYSANMPEKLVNVSAGQITYILRPDAPPLPPRQATDLELGYHIKDSTPAEKPAEEKPGKPETTAYVAPTSVTTETLAGMVEGYAGQTGEITGTIATTTGTTTETTNLLPITETNPETLQDSTPPQIGFELTPPLVTTSSSVGFGLTSDESVTFTYSLDGGASVTTGSSISLSGLSEGTHTIQITATDSAGNTSTISYTWFYGQNEYALEGSVSDESGITGSVSGSIVTASDQDAGGWLLNMSGSANGYPASSWTISMGGKGYDDSGSFNGYWLDKINGTSSAYTLSGTSYLIYLTYYTLGTGIGVLTGSYDDQGNWQATDVSLDMYTETPLSFVSEINNDLYGPTGEHFYLYSLLGGTESIWASSQEDPASVTWIGENSLISGAPFRLYLYSYNYNDDTYTTYDGGAYYGFIGGTESNNVLGSSLYALYIDPNGNAGILLGSLTGTTYSDLGMFEAEGGIYTVQIESNIGITAGDLYNSITEKAFYSTGNTDFKFNDLQMGGGFGRDYEYNGEFLSIGSSGWGIWNTRTAGSYGGLSVSDNWSWSQLYNNGSMIIGTETTGTQWSGNQLAGSSVGYGADLTSASTWVSVGETVGTFDASAQTFDAATMGVFLETNQFLQMTTTAEGQATLQQLNIPFAEVGRATLTGTDGNLSVTMNDVIFFAYSNGSSPTIWATNGVSGSYSTDPSANTTVALTGSGLSANFVVQQWTGGNWMSTVDGSGTYSGTGTLNGSSVQFSGAAAGTYGSGSLSGTGAGVTK